MYAAVCRAPPELSQAQVAVCTYNFITEDQLLLALVPPIDSIVQHCPTCHPALPGISLSGGGSFQSPWPPAPRSPAAVAEAAPPGRAPDATVSVATGKDQVCAGHLAGWEPVNVLGDCSAPHLTMPLWDGQLRPVFL
jgi:hypothetical protein